MTHRFYFTFFITAIAIGQAVAQISTTKIAPKAEQTDNRPYDSTQNYVGANARKYIGQELYLKGQPEDQRKYGYEHFYIDYQKSNSEQSNVYKCCGGVYNAKYEDMAGKYFKVLDVFKNPEAEKNEFLYGHYCFLKLQEKESGDILYYQYDKTGIEQTFPFLVVGFFEKQKKAVVGKKLILADKLLASATDIKTGAPITIKTGQEWKCTDLTIEEKYFGLAAVLENAAGETTTVSYEKAFGKWQYGNAYTPALVSACKTKFGAENFNLVLQGIVKVGMTKQMCEMAWGDPMSKSEAMVGGKKAEQWIYDGHYVVITNGVVTMMK